MAIVVTNIETASNNGNSGATAINTGSNTFNGLPLLVAISSQVTSGTPNTPTCSLSGLTFHQVATVNFNTTNRITLFTAIGSATGQILFDFGGQGQKIFGWSIVQIQNTKSTGTGASDLVVQNATNSANSGATTYTVTLGAFSNISNGVFSCVAKPATNDVVPNSGYTELGEASVSAPSWDIESMWRANNNTTPGATFSLSGGDSYGAIAVEIVDFEQSSGFFNFF